MEVHSAAVSRHGEALAEPLEAFVELPTNCNSPLVPCGEVMRQFFGDQWADGSLAVAEVDEFGKRAGGAQPAGGGVLLFDLTRAPFVLGQRIASELRQGFAPTVEAAISRTPTMPSSS